MLLGFLDREQIVFVLYGNNAELGVEVAANEHEFSQSLVEDEMIKHYARLLDEYRISVKWENLEKEKRERLRRLYTLLQADIRRIQSEYNIKMLEVLFSGKNQEAI